MSRRPSDSSTLDGGARGFEGWSLPSLDFPTFRLAMVAKVMDRLTMRQLAAESQFTFPEWRVLSRLCLVDFLTVRQIAELCWSDRAEVSRAATALEKRGLIGRRSHPRDARTPFLFATEAGRAAYEPLKEARQKFHQTLAADLSEQESAELDRILKKIADRLLEQLQK